MGPDNNKVNSHVVQQVSEDLGIPDAFPKLEISKAVKQGIKDKHLSIRKLADLVGMKHTQISRVTNGNTNYNIETLVKILNALDLKIIIKEKDSNIK